MHANLRYHPYIVAFCVVFQWKKFNEKVVKNVCTWEADNRKQIKIIFLGNYFSGDAFARRSHFCLTEKCFNNLIGNFLEHFFLSRPWFVLFFTFFIYFFSFSDFFKTFLRFLLCILSHIARHWKKALRPVVSKQNSIQQKVLCLIYR